MHRSLILSFLLFLPFLLLIHQYASATTYYVDNTSGNDINSGLAPANAWQSLIKVNSYAFFPGDSILFKCGEKWRGQLIPQSGTAEGTITYSSYGTGNKPEILGSASKNATADWINTGGNIWETATTFTTDVGNLIFNNATSFGFKKWDLNAVKTQGDFWFNKSTFKLRMYSVGNPASVYSSIECAIRQHIIDESNKSYVTYQNLSLKYGGAHGIGGGNTHHISVYDCNISFTGGGDLDGVSNTRYGNGIEFWANAHDNKVERCRIWEIYDSGLTNQNQGSTVQQYNISYRNNMIWNCSMSSFEYFNRPASSSTKGIYFENNTCVNSGFGWGGEQRPDPRGGGVLCWSTQANTDSIVIRNNIFYNARRTLIFCDTNLIPPSALVLDHNCYTQFPDSAIIEFYPSRYNANRFTTYQTTFNNDLHSFIRDPLFVNTTGADFHITAASPCINAGLSINNPVDIDNDPRYNGSIDIGADEFNPVTAVTVIQSGAKLSLLPNPATSFITIQNPKNQLIQIFSTTGVLMRETRENRIDISKLSSGIYLIRTNNQTMKLLKL